MARGIPAQIALTCCVLSLALEAHADAKTYPGVMCHPSVLTREDGAVDVFRTAPPDEASATAGTTALGGYLDCPIVRDVTGNTDGLAGAAVQVARGSGASGTAECVLSSSSQEGKLLDRETRRAQASAVLDFGATLNVSDALGYYHLFCRLPPKWTLVRYTIDERGSGRDDAQGAASAHNMKYYNAAEWCFPAERSKAMVAGFLGYPPDGFTTQSPVTCPILRSGAGAEIEHVRMHLVGGEHSAATCSLVSVADDGTFSRVTQSTKDGGRVTFDFAPTSMPNTGDKRRFARPAYLYCAFGAGGPFWAIKDYQVVEKAGP